MTEEPTKPAPSPEDEARARAQLCYTEIAAVLQKHRCIIQPVIDAPEAVGRDGSCIQIRAQYGIVPQV